YFQHVRQHEAGHRAIAEQNARDLLAALSSMRAATFQQVMDAASRTGERIVAEGRAKNRAYDVQTKHGQTQGVVLPPWKTLMRRRRAATGRRNGEPERHQQVAVGG